MLAPFADLRTDRREITTAFLHDCFVPSHYLSFLFLTFQPSYTPPFPDVPFSSTSTRIFLCIDSHYSGTFPLSFLQVFRRYTGCQCLRLIHLIDIIVALVAEAFDFQVRRRPCREIETINHCNISIIIEIAR